MIRKCFEITIIVLFLVTTVHAEDIILKEIPIKQAIAYVAGITGKTYVYIGEDIKITWEREDIAKRDIASEFEAILQKYNLEIGIAGRTITITKHRSSFNSHGVIFHRLNWISGEMLSEALADVWKDSITVKSMSDVIMLSGNRQSIEQLLLKIRKYDSPVNIEVAQIRLKEAPASKVFEVLKEDQHLKGLVNSDAWSNSILVRGGNFHKLIAESYCEKLDIPEQAREYEIINIVNLNSETVVEALSEINEATKINKISDTKILITGIPSEVKKISKMIHELDGDRVQVHITAVVAMLTDQQYKELGVKLGTTRGDMQTSVGMVSAMYDPTILFKVLSSGLGLDISATEGGASSSIISEPTLVVKSGKTAEFIVGQEVPIKTSEKISSEGTVTDTAIERKEIGIKLEVTPTVRNDFIDIELYQEISSITDGKSTVDITTNTESMKTSLMLSNGQTMIIGGIKVIERTDTDDEVPFIGGIPILGDIFGYEYENGEKRNIVISLTANIIKEV